MGRINERIMSEVGARPFLERLGLDLSPLGSAADGNIPCPFHRESNGAALSVNLDLGLLHCFGSCARGWDLVGAFAEVNGLSDGPEAWSSIEEDYLGGPSTNGHRKAPPALPAPIQKPKPPMDPVKADALHERCLGVLKGCVESRNDIARLYGIWSYSRGNIKGVYFEVRDSSTGKLCDLKRRQMQPVPLPRFKSVSLARWCTIHNLEAKRGGKCDESHAEALVRAHAGWVGLEALRTHPDHRVLIVGGEKDAFRGASHLLPRGVVPISWSGGESTPIRDPATFLGGREVVVLYDNDAPGKKGSRAAVEGLLSAGLSAALVYWDRLPSPPAEEWGKDLADYIEAGADMDSFAHAIKAAPVHSLAPLKVDLAAPGPGPKTLEDVEALTAQTPAVTAEIILHDNYTRDGLRTLAFWRDDFHIWNGSHYEIYHETESLDGVLYRFLPRGRLAATARKLSDIKHALKAFVSIQPGIQSPMWRSPPEGPIPEDLIPFRNGLLDPDKDQLLPTTPAYFNTWSLPYDYNSAADRGEPVEWLKFLRSLWGDDDDSIKTLQQMFGYCITSDTSQQKMFLVIGPPRAGKGTIGAVLEKLVGSDNTAAPMLGHFAIPHGIDNLIGKPVAIIPDATLSNRADRAQIVEHLKAISGEDRVTIQRKYKSAWTGRLPTRIILLTNEVPDLQDASGALASRFVTIRMTRSFLGKEDRGLRERLYSEIPQILMWALEGRRSLRAEGTFHVGEESKEAARALQEATTPLMVWMEENCEVDPLYDCESQFLYANYKAWAEEQGQTHRWTHQQFTNRLLAAVPGLRKVRPKSNFAGDPRRRVTFRGIRISPHVEMRQMERGR